MSWWQDELHEYLGLMQALHTAFSDRHNALITVQTLATDVVTLNKQIEKSVAASNKVFGGSKSQNRKTEELKESLKNTEEASQLAQKQYDQIKVYVFHIKSKRLYAKSKFATVCFLELLLVY